MWSPFLANYFGFPSRVPTGEQLASKADIRVTFLAEQESVTKTSCDMFYSRIPPVWDQTASSSFNLASLVL
jgi:hypothetical protein